MNKDGSRRYLWLAAKVILSLAVFLSLVGSLFFGIDVVSAFNMGAVNCGGEPVPGKKYAIFVFTDNKKTDDNEDPYVNPADAKCVLVDENQTTVSFSELLAAKVIPESFNQLPVYVNTLADAEIWSEETAPDAWVNKYLLKPNATDIDYLLSRNDETFYLGVILSSGGQVTGRVRYIIFFQHYDLAVEKLGLSEYNYLYFMGFYYPSGIGTATKSQCQIFNNQVDCLTTLKGCFWYFPQEKCFSSIDSGLCSSLKTKEWCDKSSVCTWSKQAEQCLTPTGAYAESQYGVPEGYKGPLPPCAFSGTCDDINYLLQLIVNFGKGMFMIIGSFAFVFFIYGGLTMIFSFGGEERIKKGRAILVAAVVGLIIALSAYLLIDFMLDAIDVAPEFRGIN